MSVDLSVTRQQFRGQTLGHGQCVVNPRDELLTQIYLVNWEGSYGTTD